MNTVEFTHGGKPLSPEDLNKFENEFDVALPREYRQFMLLNNGGMPNKVYYLKNNADLVVNAFFAIGSEKYSVEECFVDMKIEESLLPENMLPIGDDAFGNIICIATGSQRDGDVYLWKHEFNELKFISSSLRGILDDLQEDC